MATVIKIKNSSVTAEPGSNALAKGELAYSYSSNKLFIGQIVNSDIEATAIGGKAYTDLIATDTKTFTAAAITNDNTITIQTTANNGDIVLTPHGSGLVKTDNLGFGSNTISSENTDGDIILAPNGNGKVKTDNLSFDGSTIASFTTAGTEDTNIVLNPQANGVVNVSTSKIINVTNPTDAQDAATKSYVDTSVGNVSSDITISDNQSTPVTDTLTTGSTFTIAGTANEIETAVTDEGGSPTGNATVTIGLPDDVTVAGDLAVNGGDLTTDDTTFNLINATATTINFGGAGTAIAIGAATGTTTITHATTSTAAGNGALVVSGGTGIAENLNVGGNGVITGDLAVNGGDLTTSAGTFNLINTTATTLNIGGAATTVGIGASSGTTTINNNAVVSGNLTVNGTTTTVNSNTVTIDDPIFTLGGDSLADQVANYSTDAKDRGIEFKYSDGTSAITAGNLQDGVEYVIIDASGTDFTASPYSAGSNDAGTVFTFSGTDTGSGGGTVVVSSALKTGFFGFSNTDDKFKFLTSASNTSEVFTGTAGNVAFGDIDGANVALTGSIGNYDGAAPTNGQLLIGNTANGDLQLGTIAVTANTGLATPTLGAGSITLAGNNAGSTATVDPFRESVAGSSIEVGVSYKIITPGTNPSYTTDYANATGNAAGDTFTRATGEPVAPSDAVLLSRGGRSFSDDTTIVQADLAASAATNTSKGVASFASEQFNVNSGHVVVVEIDGGSF